MTVSRDEWWHAGGVPDPTVHVVLVGQMGVGKSTVGAALADELGRVHADCDEDLELATGATAADYAARRGLAALHEREAGVLVERLRERRGLVISAAASVVESPECRRRLGLRAVVVWLDAPPLDVASRAGRGGHRRSLTDDEVVDLDLRRRPLYAEVADLTVPPSVPIAELTAMVRSLGVG